MTNEEKLKAIISAQVKGGYKKYEYVPECLISHEPRPDKDDGMYYIDKGFIHEFEWLEAAMMPKPILLILLDTEGCKAAYGEELKYTMWKTMDCEQLRLPKWNECSSTKPGEGLKNNARSQPLTTPKHAPSSARIGVIGVVLANRPAGRNSCGIWNRNSFW